MSISKFPKKQIWLYKKTQKNLNSLPIFHRKDYLRLSGFHTGLWLLVLGERTNFSSFSMASDESSIKTIICFSHHRLNKAKAKHSEETNWFFKLLVSWNELTHTTMRISGWKSSTGCLKKKIIRSLRLSIDACNWLESRKKFWAGEANFLTLEKLHAVLSHCCSKRSRSIKILEKNAFVMI